MAFFRPVALALVVQAVGGSPLKCVGTGEDCTHGEGCCETLDKCEVVNQYYSKCVTQPKCAAAGAQCAGKGDTVMEKTACCDKGFVCHDLNQWFSKCVNGSAPIPPPPPPPKPSKCSADGAQCAGGSFPAKPCCGNSSSCEAVNQYFSKCIFQPKCSAENGVCEGSGERVFKKTACCDATADTCVPWGDNWSVCRKKGQETCSVHGEQCAGTGGSQMKEKKCCDSKDTCVKVNQYYSKCDSSAGNGVFGAVLDSCPGLEHCPAE